MPGKQVKNWPQYEALRKQGHSKESAARITNAASKERKMPNQDADRNPVPTPRERAGIQGRYKRNREWYESSRESEYSDENTARRRANRQAIGKPAERAAAKARIRAGKDRGASTDELSSDTLAIARDKFQTKRGDKKTEDYGHTADNPKAEKIAAIKKLSAQVRSGRLAGAKRGR